RRPGPSPFLHNHRQFATGTNHDRQAFALTHSVVARGHSIVHVVRSVSEKTAKNFRMRLANCNTLYPSDMRQRDRGPGWNRMAPSNGKPRRLGRGFPDARRISVARLETWMENRGNWLNRGCGRQV